MRTLSERIYLRSPIFLQNLAVCIAGYRIDQSQHGGLYTKFFKEEMSRWDIAPDHLKEYIEKEITRVIVDAVENVPYYKELFKSHGLRARDIRSVEDLRRIPLLEKESIRRDPLQFIHKEFRGKPLMRLHTTGTTGTPLTIYCTKEVRQRNYAFYNRFLAKNGIRSRGRRATFGTKVIVPNGQKSPPFWRYSLFQKNLLLSSYHLTEKTVLDYIHQLNRFLPDYIDGYPSTLSCIAQYAQKYSLRLNHITPSITTSAETLFSEQRQLIESQFEAPVLDQYGSAEMCVFVGQCTKGNYHIHTDYGWLELLREDGEPAEPGEKAELACTGFINPIMPLIRYRIGDCGIRSEKPCECGSPFPVLEKILGRVDDFIVTPDGRRIARLGPLFKGYPVKEAQYIQEDLNELIVLVVPDDGFDQAAEAGVMDEIRKRVGFSISIRMKLVPKIDRSAGGKFRTVVSKIVPPRDFRGLI